MRTLGAPAPVVLVGGLRDVDAFADGVRGLQRHRAATTTADDAAPLDHHQSAVGDGATPGRHPREADAEVVDASDGAMRLCLHFEHSLWAAFVIVNAPLELRHEEVELPAQSAVRPRLPEIWHRWIRPARSWFRHTQRRALRCRLHATACIGNGLEHDVGNASDAERREVAVSHSRHPCRDRLSVERDRDDGFWVATRPLMKYLGVDGGDRVLPP